ncbi:MAG: methionine adenosyltransferase, partial [Aquificaceae bacterium]|nr:methionine adenosyltransferase [Aquificaceae bacterium]
EGHPDKLADLIADALLDEFIRKDPYSRVSLEIMVHSGLTIVAGHVSTDGYVDIHTNVRKTIKEVGYNRPEYGFDADSSAVLTSIEEQSPDIATGIFSDGAGDTATVVGFACDETPSYMPLPISLSNLIAKRLSELRKSGAATFLRPDGKVLIAVAYENEVPLFVKDIVIFCQHEPDADQKMLFEFIYESVIKQSVPASLLKDTKVLVNPSGRFVLGGPAADVGQTGRKAVSDAYGDVAYSGGSSFSGKDPTKTDRTASYMARMMAKHVVASNLAKRCLIKMAYAFGVSYAVAFEVETFGTESVPTELISKTLLEIFPTSPKGMIEAMSLRRPIYKSTACYGHFGKEGLPWEELKHLEAFLELQKSV